MNNDSKPSNDNKLSVALIPNIDRNGKKYYLGKLRFPGTIDCKDGVVFMMFVSEDGAEELQIGTLVDKPRDSKSETRSGRFGFSEDTPVEVMTTRPNKYR